MRRQFTGLSGAWLLILYAALVSLPLLLVAMSGRSPVAGAWLEATVATGSIAGAMLMMQLVTSGRFERLSGRVGIDVMMAFHKWTARVLLAVALAHPLMAIAPVDPSRPLASVNHLLALLAAPRYRTGVLALALAVVVVPLAKYRGRLPVGYELWRASHGIMAVAAVWLLIEHVFRVSQYAGTWPVAAFWIALAVATTASALFVYTIRAWRMRFRPWRVEMVSCAARGLWWVSLRSEGVSTLRFRAGQFVWAAFDPRRFPLFDHPFSIASAPGDGRAIDLLVKEGGDFTDRIGTVAPGTRVGIDAPHGSFILDDLDADSVILIAGGVGIAPVMSMLGDLAARKDPRPIRLVYGCNSASAMIDPARINALAVGLDFRAAYLVEDGSDAPACEPGIVSAERLRNMLVGLDARRSAALICGPAAMMAAVADELSVLGVPLASIRYERFDYGEGPRSVKDRRIAAGFWLMAASVGCIALAFVWRP